MDAYGLDLRQFRVYVVEPTLVYLGLHSEVATQLVLGTCLVESGLTYLRQRGGGPALGVAQMEPATHDDIWRNWLPAQKALRSKILVIEGAGDSAALVGSLNYAVAMCRIHYARVAAPLPAAGDCPALAAYHKKWYNTGGGATDPSASIRHFQAACAT